MLDVIQIQEILPHRFPFLLFVRVTEIDAGKSIKAYKNITIGEQIFQGHFPGHPIYPGVMIIEGLAQAGGVLAFKSNEGMDISTKVVYFTSIDETKFRSPVRPGDRLDYEIEVLKHRGSMWVMSAKAYVDGKLCCESKLSAMLVDK